MIVIEEPAPHALRSLSELLGQGRGAYATPEAADALHAATALENGTDAFVSNDACFAMVLGLELMKISS